MCVSYMYNKRVNLCVSKQLMFDFSPFFRCRVCERVVEECLLEVGNFLPYYTMFVISYVLKCVYEYSTFLLPFRLLSVVMEKESSLYHRFDYSIKKRTVL